MKNTHRRNEHNNHNNNHNNNNNKEILRGGGFSPFSFFGRVLGLTVGCLPVWTRD